MSQREKVAAFFDQKTASFDGIYSGRKSRLGRLWDGLTRQNIRYRFQFTMDAGDPWRDKRVLDVGCGSGRYCVEAAARGAAEVVGIDLSADMLHQAEQLAKHCKVDQRCRFVRADVMQYDDPEAFDVVIANGFFDYVREPSRVLARLRPLVRHKLIATFPTLWAFRVPPRWVWIRLNGCPIRFYTYSGVARLCTEAGLRCTKLVRRGPIYMLVAESESD